MHWTRRTLLGGIASATVPLAGCSMDGPADGSSDGGADGGEFERVAVEGRTLVVEFGELSADTVNVIAPDGTAFASRSVAQGATTVEIDIGLSYEPGEYQVVASADESTVAETSLTIAPELEILEVGVGANHPDRMPDGLNFADEQAIVEISNTGSGPGVVDQLLILGDVPNPTTELAQGGNEESGIFDVEQGYGNLSRASVPAGETAVLFSTSMPFLFSGDGIMCKDSPQTGEFEAKISVEVGDGPLAEIHSIRYSASEQPDQCEITVGDG
jgi:hypothetical protein